MLNYAGTRKHNICKKWHVLHIKLEYSFGVKRLTFTLEDDENNIYMDGFNLDKYGK